MHETATSLVAEAIGCAAATIGPQTGLGTVAGWDSLGHMRLIMEVERRLERELTPDEIISIRTVEDVSAILTGGPK